MQITILGSSGYGITSTRSLPSIVIDRTILFDCGEGCLAALIHNDISVSNIKKIFLTHLHADHFLGLISILYKLAFYSSENTSNRTQERSSPTIYVPVGMRNNILNVIDATFTPFERINYRIDIVELLDPPADPIKFELGDMKYSIDYIPMIHNPKGLCYRINKQVVITGDTSVNPPLNEFVKGCKILIHESSFPDNMGDLAHKVGHCSPSDAAKVAKAGGIHQLILYHVPDIPLDKEYEFIKDAQDIFKNIRIAHDNESYETK